MAMKNDPKPMKTDTGKAARMMGNESPIFSALKKMFRIVCSDSINASKPGTPHREVQVVQKGPTTEIAGPSPLLRNA
jgi:hypothetical protein